MFNFFFFNDTATTEIYTLSLHDALPICVVLIVMVLAIVGFAGYRVYSSKNTKDSGSKKYATFEECIADHSKPDRKSTRLNSSHANISYAVFCLKKKYIHNL